MFKNAIVLIILGTLLPLKQVFAQYISINGQFEVDQQYGCHDLTVTITNIDPGTDPTVVVFQFDGFNSPTTQDPVHTYTTPGTYWINQYIQGGTGQKKDSVQVTVVAPELPDVELFSCNNFEVLVQIYDSYYDVYEIDYDDGTVIQVNPGDVIPPYTYANGNTRNIQVTGLFTTATNRCGITSNMFSPLANVLPAQIDSLVALNNSTLKLDYQLPANSVNKLEVSVNDNLNYVLYKSINQNTTIDTLTNLNISQNNYCFRIATYDACSNFKSYSNEVCSVNLMASAQNNQITLDWNTVDLGSGQVSEVVRDGVSQVVIPSPTFKHIDSTINCNTTYCYWVDATFPGGAIGRSKSVCETSFSNDQPATIENISSVTGTESVNWSWEVPMGIAPEVYTVYETDSQGNILRTSSSTISTFSTSAGDSLHYLAVQLRDSCGNSSAISNLASSLLLKGTRNQAEEIVLSWNDYFGWVEGLQQYMLTIYDTRSNLLDSLNIGFNTTYTLPLDEQMEQTLIFTVWAIPINSVVSNSRSNQLLFEHPPIIAIPNTFTPNDDGLNDRFTIQGKFISTYEMQVYNRWGEVLFHTTDMDTGWDGKTSEGKKLPLGNYAYWIRIKDFNNNEHIRTGSVLILSN